LAIRAIVFDLDGTLVDSFEAIHASLIVAMTSLNLPPWDLDTTVRHVGRGVDFLVESAVGPALKDKALELFRTDYAKTCLTRTRLLPTVCETLTRLVRSGYALAVATNKPIDFTRNILEHLGVASYFRCVLGPEQVARPKPAPDMLQAILASLEVQPSQCLYVGDMPLDVETATQAGVSCILVATGAFAWSDLVSRVAVPVYRSLAEIADALERRNSP